MSNYTINKLFFLSLTCAYQIWERESNSLFVFQNFLYETNLLSINGPGYIKLNETQHEVYFEKKKPIANLLGSVKIQEGNDV